MVQDKSPVLRGRIWDAPCGSTTGGGLRVVLVSTMCWTQRVIPALRMGTHYCAGLECIGLGMGVHWDKLGHRVGMQDGHA